MNVNEAVETQEFFKKMRREQANYVVTTVAPTIAEYFEQIKYLKNDKYKDMILEFLEELNNSKDANEMREIVKRYQDIVDDYKDRIEKIERHDDDIGVMEGSDIEKTKELIKPVDLICGFVDNLIYGGYSQDHIKQYYKIWKEKSTVNIVEPSDFTVSKSGRHVNLAYVESDEQQKQEEKQEER